MYILTLIILLISSHVSYGMDKPNKPRKKPKKTQTYVPKLSSSPKHKEEKKALTKSQTYNVERDPKRPFPPLPEINPPTPPINITPAENVPFITPDSKKDTRETEEKQGKKLSTPLFPIPFGKKRSSSFDSGPRYKSKDTYDLTHDVLKGNIPRIKNFLKNHDNNPNQQAVTTLLTPLHVAVLQNNENIVKILIMDPRVNSLIRNKDNSAAFQYIIEAEKEKYKALYNALLFRANLDQIVNAIIMTDKDIIKNSNEEVMEKLHTIMMRIDTIIPGYAEPKFILAMIHSRLKLNLIAIKKFLDEREQNPNALDEWGNTCLHHATYLRDKALLLSLLKNPKINSLIKNCEGLFAHQLISSIDKNYSELRLLLFARNSLDLWIKKQIPYLQLMNPKTDQYTLSCEDEGFKEIVKEIKKQSENIKKSQGDDRELPPEVIYPDYADEKFLLEAFAARMKDDKPINKNASLFTEFRAVISSEESSQSSTKEIDAADIKEPEPRIKKVLPKKPSRRFSKDSPT